MPNISNRPQTGDRPRIIILCIDMGKTRCRRLLSRLLSELSSRSEVQLIDDPAQVHNIVTQVPKPQAVLIADGALTRDENWACWTAFLFWIRRGGRCILMSGWPRLIEGDDKLRVLFSRAGLNWQQRHETMYLLTATTLSATGREGSTTRPGTYMRAKCLQYVGFHDRLLVLNIGVNGHSDLEESPVAMTEVQDGRLGYVGFTEWDTNFCVTVVVKICGFR
ncbi:hypothetical protein N7451_004265 [Penicillium sp. IBT 35674x]|nr:hypothetical protein N7451_004265 [Penicillium sp. IBT 35674x]